MLPPSAPPVTEVDLQRRDTEIAVAVFRTIFLLIILFSPQFLQARGVRGSLLMAVVIVAAAYNVLLFILHLRKFPVSRLVIVIADVILISLWIFFAGEEGERFFVLYFAVVIVSGLWFRVGGAFAVGLLASALYVWAVLIASLPAGAERVALGTVALQITLLLVTAGVVSIAAEVQARERQELALSRAVLQQHRQRIRIAQYVDEMLRPRSLPTSPGLDIAFRFRPAAIGVSGDYYDVIPLGPRRWGICIADVRAKQELGLAYLPLFKSALRLAARREHSPGSVLTHMNREVATEIQEREELEAFISMSYTVIDLDQGELTQTNAGIEPAVLVPASGGELVDLGASGIVLGVLADATYEEQKLSLHTRDTLVLFTDGMTEATDRRDRFLGREGLLKQILAHAQAPTAEAMAQRIFEYVIGYSEGGRRRDDMTLLVVRVTAPDLGQAVDARAPSGRQA